MARKKKRQQRIYDVTIEGEYFKGENQTNTLAPYKETVRLNEDHREAGFLYVWKNLLASKWMPSRYPGYGGLHTHYLVSAVDIEDPEAVPNDPNLMSLDQLIAFIEFHGLPVITDLYRDEDGLRQAVIECIEDEEAFRSAQERRRTSQGHSVQLTSSLNDLNPGLGAGLKAKATGAKKVNTDNLPEVEDVETPSDKAPAFKEETDIFDEDALKENDDEDALEKPKKGSRRKKVDLDDDIY